MEDLEKDPERVKKEARDGDSASTDDSSTDLESGSAGPGVMTEEVKDGGAKSENAKAGDLGHGHGHRLEKASSRRSYCSRKSQRSATTATHHQSPHHHHHAAVFDESLALPGHEDDGNDDDDDANSNGGGDGGDNANTAVSRIRTTTSIGSAASRPPGFEVVFDEDDGTGGKSDNPRSWPVWYRAWVIFSVSFSTWVVVFYSTNYTAATPGLMAEFNTSSVIVTLGVTTYLLGLAVGSVIVAPMSELYGRRPVYLICMSIYVLLIIPTGLATSLAEILVVRFFGALFGAAMISNGPGTITDIADEEYRALYLSLWSLAPLNGPVTGPLIGGFVFAGLGWRWDNWLALILAGASLVLQVFVKETYAPVLLQKKAAARRKETDDDRWWSRYDQTVPKRDLLKVNLIRPFALSLTEPILWFFNVWISLIYGILYLCFVAYPIIFSQHRGWGPGITGLAFVGIGIGTLLAIVSEPLLRRFINMHRKDPVTGKVPPEAAARVMLIGAVLAPIGQLGFSWTSLPTSIHWAAPIAFGIPFGAGNTLCFIYGSNYLAGAYGIYAASALAGNAVIRSIFGGVLPLAGPSMYERLTPQWAGTLLGLLEVLLIPIPWAFYRYGEKIRAKSPIIRQMREDMAKNESRAARAAAAKDRSQAAAGVGGVGGVVAEAKDELVGVGGGSGSGSGSSGGVLEGSVIPKDDDAARDVEKGTTAASRQKEESS